MVAKTLTFFKKFRSKTELRYVLPQPEITVIFLISFETLSNYYKLNLIIKITQ